MATLKEALDSIFKSKGATAGNPELSTTRGVYPAMTSPESTAREGRLARALDADFRTQWAAYAAQKAGTETDAQWFARVGKKRTKSPYGLDR